MLLCRESPSQHIDEDKKPLECTQKGRCLAKTDTRSPNKAVEAQQVNITGDEAEKTDSTSTKVDIKYLLEPHQPKGIQFPFRTYGKQTSKRCFKAAWFDQISWLHYEEQLDAVFCFNCLQALHNQLISAAKGENAFTETGYSNWKNALEKKKGFSKHELSECHKEAVARLITIPKTAAGDIGDMISSQHALERKQNRNVLLKILSNIRYLARQSSPLRGDWQAKEKSETDSNFWQLLKLRCEDDPTIVEWLKRRQFKYTSPTIQNEMLEIMALQVLREIAQNVKSAVTYSILADESSDVSNKEQLVFCVRWVDDSFNANEDFIGMHPLLTTEADHIVAVIKDVLLRIKLRIEDARGQCYDGASIMSGSKSGVATQLKLLNKKCLYTHCYGHALNLAVGDAIKSVGFLESIFDTAREICKLIKLSPKRNSKLDEIRKDAKNVSKSVHALCPTRWTVRGEALQSFLNNFHELMELWEWTLSKCKDADIKARVRGVKSVMKTFDFVFGCQLAVVLLRQTDNLSRTLQNPQISAAQGNRIALDVVKTLSKDRNEESFNMFWEMLLIKNESLGGKEPELCRKRKVPAKLDFNSASIHYFPSNVREHYRHVYFAAFDSTVESIKERFNQEDFKRYTSLQELFLKAVRGERWNEEMEEVVAVYGDDFCKFQLEGQLSLLRSIAESNGLKINSFTIHDFIQFLQKLDNSQKCILSEVVKLAKILLAMPATNAVSERSFSALKRIKTYLRATSTDKRMNHLMLLHIHKDRLDSLDMVGVANEFVARFDSRRQIFGTVSKADTPKKVEMQHKATQT